MLQPYQLEAGQVVMRGIVIELAFPLFKAPVVREALIKAAEIWVCYLLQVRLGRSGHACAAGRRIAQQRNWWIIARNVVVVTQVDKKSVIAHAEPRAQSPVP